MDITLQIQNILLKAGNAINGRDADDMEDEEPTYDSIVEWKSTVLVVDDNGDTTESAESQSPRAAEPLTSEALRQQWYKTGHDYYEDESKCPATVDGVLGGFANLSPRDLKTSEKFLKKIQATRPEFNMKTSENGGLVTYALECGAGIGRVSKGLLLPLGFACDLVEPSERLLSNAPDYIGEDNSTRCRFFCSGLQDFTPQPDRYNIIFIQWVIGYLTDDDLVSFLKRCSVGLRRGGVIVIKDNTCVDVAFVADTDDASVTRSLSYILAIVQLAGLKVVLEEYQEDFPNDIFPVPMLALCSCEEGN